MTRNQQLPKYAANLSGGVMFTVKGQGDISPATEQLVKRGDTIVIDKDPSLDPSVTHVCARQEQQKDVCQCSALVGVASGAHMAIGGAYTYTIQTSVAVNSDYELYSLTDGEPTPGATNGDIHINS